MRLIIEVDATHHEIDSTNPDLLGKWLVEIFGRYRITPATDIRVQAIPSYIPDGKGGYLTDWTVNAQLWSQVRQVHSPRELVNQLSAFMDEWEGRPGE